MSYIKPQYAPIRRRQQEIFWEKWINQFFSNDFCHLTATRTPLHREAITQ